MGGGGKNPNENAEPWHIEIQRKHSKKKAKWESFKFALGNYTTNCSPIGNQYK